MNDSGVNFTNPHYIIEGKQTVLSQKPHGTACDDPSFAYFYWFMIYWREGTRVSVCKCRLHTWSFSTQ